MISPDDPRHGSHAGYRAGCDQECCRKAHSAYRRELSKDHILGRPRRVPIDESQRLVQALMYLGHGYRDIAEYSGVTHITLGRIMRSPPTKQVLRSTAEGIQFAYTSLSPQLGKSKKAKTAALQRGWRWKDR